jgi:hypothetical protein
MQPTTAILIGACAATIGWIYTARRAHILSRKQYMITVILNASSNERFIRQRDLIAPHLKNGQCPTLWLNGNHDQLRDALRDVLNHYEFVAAGLRNGDFDEKLLKDSERSTFVRLFARCEEYIWQLRNGRERMTIYEHLEWLHQRWEKAPPGLFQRSIEFLRGRPFYGGLERRR